MNRGNQNVDMLGTDPYEEMEFVKFLPQTYSSRASSSR